MLARYLQILSDELITGVETPVINIYHSFLPAFIGGRLSGNKTVVFF